MYNNNAGSPKMGRCPTLGAMVGLQSPSKVPTEPIGRLLGNRMGVWMVDKIYTAVCYTVPWLVVDSGFGHVGPSLSSNFRTSTVECPANDRASSFL